MTQEPCVVNDPNDDAERELKLYFFYISDWWTSYQLALDCARIGRHKIESAKIPFTRPDDYFAEMLKSDITMSKVSEFNIKDLIFSD